MKENLKITKNITSRKGNKYEINLDLLGRGDDSFEFCLKSNDEKIVARGSWRNTHDGDDSLIKMVRDIVMKIEGDSDKKNSLNVFEKWDGVIE